MCEIAGGQCLVHQAAKLRVQVYNLPQLLARAAHDESAQREAAAGQVPRNLQLHSYSMPRRRLMPALCALPLVLGAAGCSDLLGPISPDGAGPYFSDLPWTETADSVLIDFESVPVFSRVGNFYFRGAGVRFPDWATVVDPAIPWFGQYWYTTTPAMSGKHIIGLGYPWPERVEGDFTFYQPVTAVSLSVRAIGDFFMTCYNGAGESVGEAIAQGYKYPEPYDPVRVQRLSITADGIVRCRVSVQGGSVDDFSFKRTRTASVKLTCTGDRGADAVTRGQEIVCRASKDPESAPGELTVTGWSFNGTDRTDGDPTLLEWRGVMVRAGTVQVTGKVETGTERSASATIEVVDREWPDIPTMHLLELGATGGENGVPPLAATISWASDLGSFRAFPEPPSGEPVEDPITDVQGGPNDGLNYFADLSFPIWGRIRINDAAMSRGSAFYEAQERNSTGGRTKARRSLPAAIRRICEGCPTRVGADDGHV